MKKVILIRFGEIFLKGKNKQYFESSLIKNIKKTLYGLTYSFIATRGRYVVEELSEEEFDLAFSRLQKVCGVFSISPAYVEEADLDKVSELACSMIDSKVKTFRITVNRADKRFPINSMDFAKLVGGKILAKFHYLRVDLFNPDTNINIDIRDNGRAYVFNENVYCVGGMPVGTAGKGIVLLSGGIDSPVALFRMAKRGMEVTALHFHSYPYTGELAKEKVIQLAKILCSYAIHINLITVSVTEIQEEIHKKCHESMMITLLRRFMMRIAKEIAKEKRCLSVTTGESLAQVASQTQESITCTNSVIDIPVFRPLIGMDKSEIIITAKQIGTFETSIEPYEDCCTVFLPDSPQIHPTVEACEKAERALEISALVERALATKEEIFLDIKDN